MSRTPSARVWVGCGVLAIAAGCTVSPTRGTAPAPDAARHDAGLFLTLDAGAPGPFPEDSGLGIGDRLGPAVSASVPPPAISGGTLLTSATDGLAFVSDPEDDRVIVVDTSALAVLGELALTAHDEPGRLALESPTRLHVVLRRGGAVATIDVSTPSAPTLVERRAVCPAPRGIAYDAARTELFVACAGGELVVLPPAGPALRTLTLPDDLRDVVIDETHVLVTRFRSAEVLVVDPDTGAVSETLTPPSGNSDAMVPFAPGVAWRAITRPGGGALVLHQRSADSELDTTSPGAYGGSDCRGAIVTTALAFVRSGTEVPDTHAIGCTPLSVDVALSPDGVFAAIASAGAYPLDDRQIHVYPLDQLGVAGGGEVVDVSPFSLPLPGRIVAIAYAASGDIVAQTRAPATLVVVAHGTPLSIPLGGTEHADTGFDVFHSNAGAGVACASCHPEGGDDGRVWHFAAVGASRTIPLRGGITGTAPFHWRGEFAAMSSLLDDVFGSRMRGGRLLPEYETALLTWLDTVPQLPARTVTDADAVLRGRVLFESTEVGCTTCHAGALGSNDLDMNVGTGGSFQVPSLHGVSYRAPYLHDGRAPTLSARFEPSGGGDAHGHTSTLTSAQIADLVAYLQTL